MSIKAYGATAAHVLKNQPVRPTPIPKVPTLKAGIVELKQEIEIPVLESENVKPKSK